MTISYSSDVSLPGLRRIVVRDADLADVVEQACQADRADRGVVQLQLIGQEDRVSRDILGVPLRVPVLRVDGEDEALEDVEARRAACILVVVTGDPDGVAAAGLGRAERLGDRREQHGQRSAVHGIAPRSRHSP